MSELEKTQARVDSVVSFLVLQGMTSVMLVGSAALMLHGVMLPRVPGDIDVEVIADEGMKKILGALVDAHPVKGRTGGDGEYDPRDGKHPYIFNIHHYLPNGEGEDIPVNVWAVEEHFTHPTDAHLWYGKALVAPVTTILAHKMSYRRKKDYMDLNAIAMAILLVGQPDCFPRHFDYVGGGDGATRTAATGAEPNESREPREGKEETRV